MSKAGQSLKWVLLDSIHQCNDLRSFKQIHVHLLTSALVTNDLVITKAANFLGKIWTVRNGFVLDVYTIPAVLKSCVKFSGTGEVFDDILVRDVVSWTGLISGYVKAGLFNEAIGLFLRMDVEPNVATFVSILGACGKLGCLNLGRGIHGLGMKCLYVKELVVCNAVLDMYMRCESVTDARQMFDEIPEKDIKWDVHVGTALVDMYAKCGYIDMAQLIFSGMPSRNIRTCNAYTDGLAINGHVHGDYSEDVGTKVDRPDETIVEEPTEIIGA
ncbi:unnamed protein product [Sphenostylis stenocarpa]|uniref:Pentatricopeptide repeat-containing protein n=1 Tax=Sphenostylis stenocarpa TaxID=92480 RepID=A0AA86W2M3_9FABA|nr:unnamed protein product [Sphenostylis stenocarpa]